MTDTPTAERPRKTRWPVIVLGIAAAAALAFGIGRFTAFGATSVPAAPGSTSAEAGFARDMQVHHAQAVEMAMTIYRTTGDGELRTLAYDIATGQSAQQGQMYDWLVQWGLPQAGDAPMSWMAGSGSDHDHSSPMTPDEMSTAMGMATDAERERLAAAEGVQADCLFLELMTRHHQGAIPMVEAVIDLGTDPNVLGVAASMKATQTAEVDAMATMQTRLGCTD